MAKKKSLFVKVIKIPFQISYSIFKYTGKAVLGSYKLIKKSKSKLNEKRIYKKRPASFNENEIIIVNGKGDINNFLNLLDKSKIGIIVGGAGSGKSSLAMLLAENIKTLKNKKIYAVGFSENELPKWITPIKLENLENLENNSLLILDEAGIGLNSRRSMAKENVFFSNLLNIRRHKGISILAILQNSSNIDLNFIRQSSFVIFKKFDLFQQETERKVISSVYNNIKDEFTNHYNQHGQKLSYIYSEEFNGFIASDLPSFWTENLSKSFK